MIRIGSYCTDHKIMRKACATSKLLGLALRTKNAMENQARNRRTTSKRRDCYSEVRTITLE